MLRFYFSQSIGTGVVGAEDPVRPALVDVIGNAVTVHGIDLATGFFFCWVDVTDAQHTTIIADARNAWLAFANAAGPLPITATIGDLSNPRRTQCRNLLETHHVPLDDLTNSDTLRQVVARVPRRALLRSALTLRYANGRRADTADFTEGLDTLVSAMNATKRAALNDRLQEMGYDTSVVLGTDTIRQALGKLLLQDVVFARNEWD